MYINKHIHQASLKEVEPGGSLSNGDQVVPYVSYPLIGASG